MNFSRFFFLDKKHFILLLYRIVEIGSSSGMMAGEWHLHKDGSMHGFMIRVGKKYFKH
jgi:hypothetical protein